MDSRKPTTPFNPFDISQNKNRSNCEYCGNQLTQNTRECSRCGADKQPFAAVMVPEEEIKYSNNTFDINSLPQIPENVKAKQKEFTMNKLRARIRDIGIYLEKNR